MSKMYLIYSADEAWAIGKNNDLLVRIPEDMTDRFKALTLNTAVVMGKNTLLSLPKQKGLPKRVNYVLTRNKDLQFENAVTVNSFEELFGILKDCKTDIFVIGGGEIYTQLMPYCNGAFVTKIYKTFDDATVFVPNLDKAEGWRIVKETPIMMSEVGVEYSYVDYVNDSPLEWR